MCKTSLNPTKATLRSKSNSSQGCKEVNRAPCEPVPFTLAQLKAAIPAHCFERSNAMSFFYLAINLIAVALLYFATTLFDHPLVPTWAKFVLWPAYWYFQGALCTGIWVIAHECGHGGFSASRTICDAVGLVLHSALLVPYHSWRISHAKHHRSTGDADHDEAFAPNVEADVPSGIPGDLQCFFEIFAMLLLGWPLYLTTHVTGRKYEEPVNHFNPSCKLFSKNEYWAVVISNIGLLVAASLLVFTGYKCGFLWLMMVYGVPLLVVNKWLVMITFLQHTDITLPHFRNAEWNWLRGALCTVDRDYGMMNFFHHHIGDTHVCHHLFSAIPFYHAQEATAALKPLLGEYYRFDSTNIYVALWRSSKLCRFVSNTGDILWFRHE